MADQSPPDKANRAGAKGNTTSGSVADFRYKASPPPTERPPAAEPDGGTAARSGQSREPRSEEKQAGGNTQDHGQDNGQIKGQSNTPTFGGNNRARPARKQAYAALDLGTNNCRLLIAKPSGEDFTVIDAFSRVVKLGEGLANSGRLSDEAMDRALGALTICADKLRRRNVFLARSVATEACRRASNGQRFIERVREETGIVLDIISAQEEARLAVLGCHVLLEQSHGPAVIFDIGGGSTELVLIEPGDRPEDNVPRILDWQSVPWGVVSLSDTIERQGDKPEQRAARYAAMRKTVSDSFAPFAERVMPWKGKPDPRLLGTSGTVTTLASLHLELPHYDRQAVDGLIVPSGSMRDICTRLARMTWAERSGLACIGHDRAELVVAGCAILEAILDLWPTEQLGVADRGIREGILRSLMAADLTPHNKAPASKASQGTLPNGTPSPTGQGASA